MNSKCVLKNLGTGGRGTGVHFIPVPVFPKQILMKRERK